MDARREYIMKDLKKRCKHKRRVHKLKRKRRKIDDCKKIDFNNRTKEDDKIDRLDLIYNRKKVEDSVDDLDGSDNKWKDDTEDLCDNNSKDNDFQSRAKFDDYNDDDYCDQSDSEKAEDKPRGSEFEDYDCDLPGEIKTKVNTSEEESYCNKPQRISLDKIFKRSNNRCAKDKNFENDECEAIASTSFADENRLSKLNGLNTPSLSKESDDVVLYRNENIKSEYKSQRKKPEISNVEGNNLEKCTCKKQKSQISPECARLLKKNKRKRLKSKKSSKSKTNLSAPSSPIKHEFEKKTGKDDDECKCDKANSDLSLECKSLFEDIQIKSDQESDADLSSSCENLLKQAKRQRRSNCSCPNSGSERRKKKARSELSPSCKRLLKAQKKILKTKKGSFRPSPACKKLLSRYKKTKNPSPECKKLLKAEKNKNAATTCACDLPKKRMKRRKRKKSHAPLLEDCRNQLKKMNQALSKRILQKQTQLLASSKKGRRKKKVDCKPTEEQEIINCRCASSNLKDKYTRMMEDYHRLKRQYDELKCTNAIIEKKLRCFMKKIKCKCTK